MTAPTKIDFHHRRINQIQDITDIVEMLFPGNRNQQHAAARILLALKSSKDLIPSLAFIEKQYGISRRTLQRTRAKLSRLDLIEHITWMNSRYGGQQGWKLSSRFSTALCKLAQKVEGWRADGNPGRVYKEETLVDVLRP